MQRYAKFLLIGLIIVGFLSPLSSAQLSSKEWGKVKRDLKAALTSEDSSRIVDSVRVAGRDGSPRAVNLLLSIGANLEDVDVFDAVKTALADMTEPDAIGAMIRKFNNRDWRIKVLLCEALTKTPGDNVRDAIIDQLQDKVPYVIQAAVKSLATRGDHKAVTPLIDTLKRVNRSKGVVWAEVRKALIALTGENFETPEHWRHWWSSRKDDFDPTRDKGNKDPEGTVVRAPKSSPKFFKEAIISKRIMFIMDVSDSMKQADPPQGDKGGGVRIERVKKELNKAVKSFQKGVKFNIIAFCDKIEPWKEKLLPATSKNKADAAKFVNGMQPAGSTHTDTAFEEAFKNKEITTILFLSDGAPFKGPGTPATLMDDILKFVRTQNRFRKIKIHTFGFASLTRTNLGAFMKQLAEENGGNFNPI